MTDMRAGRGALGQGTEDSAVASVKQEINCVFECLQWRDVLPARMFLEAEFMLRDAVHSTFINVCLSEAVFSYLFGESSSAYKARFACFL